VTDYELHAQYPPAFDVYAIQVWHIARVGRAGGLCGQLLDPVADVRPLSAYPALSRAGRCQRCRNAYRALLTRPAPACTAQPRPAGVRRTGLVSVPGFGTALPEVERGPVGRDGIEREV
jgi:hypothetical protein